jgi:hypothetical protein
MGRHGADDQEFPQLSFTLTGGIDICMDGGCASQRAQRHHGARKMP